MEQRNLVRVPHRKHYPLATPVPPSRRRFLLILASIEPRPLLAPKDRVQRRFTRRARQLCAQLRHAPGVIRANAFSALLRPHVPSRYRKRADQVPRQPDFELVVLVEAEDDAALDGAAVRQRCGTFVAALDQHGAPNHVFRASEARRLGHVRHDAGAVYLFNFFWAEDADQNLAVWERTAGWFVGETGLDNSSMLRPDAHADVPYLFVNHCRWDNLGAVLPSLALKPSARSYVMRHFDANRTVPMPVLYRLVP